MVKPRKQEDDFDGIVIGLTRSFVGIDISIFGTDLFSFHLAAPTFATARGRANLERVKLSLCSHVISRSSEIPKAGS
jgi:hypothetical protein